MLSLALLCALFSLFTLFAFSALIIFIFMNFFVPEGHRIHRVPMHTAHISHFFLFRNVYSCMHYILHTTTACSLLGLRIGPAVYFCLGLCCSQEGCIVVLGFFLHSRNIHSSAICAANTSPCNVIKKFF